MRYTSRELKSRARDILLGKYLFVIGALLLSNLISYGISVLAAYAQPSGHSILASFISLLCAVITLLLIMILSTGSLYLYLNISRKRDCRLSDIFYAFSHHPDRIIILSILLFLISTVCMIPFFILFFFFAFPAGLHTSFLGNPFFLFLAALLCTVLAVSILLNYVPVFYLYVDDPEKPALTLLRESRRLMYGNRFRYFRLQLSFLGMGLLAVLSLGIGLLWIIPYVSVTNAYFYQNLLENDNQ
ncbi:MAG: DUF975 family protein [Lachnospiraceae bacterium]|nr:DUF975 family protein [Lachnospiraceae bacterium]